MHRFDVDYACVMTRAPTNYWDYIRVNELLSLQSGLGDAEATNDEVLFITVHQIDELWFKLALREIDAAVALFEQENVPEQALSTAVRSLKRASTIFEHLAQHFALMETMTTRDYLGFRDKLMPASGFQSAQLREIELALGLQDDVRVPLGTPGDYKAALKTEDDQPTEASRRVEQRALSGRSLRAAIEMWLYRTPIEGSRPSSVGDRDVCERLRRRYLDAMREEIDAASARALELAQTDSERDRLKARYSAQLGANEAYLRATEVDESKREKMQRVRLALLLIESYRELPLLAWPREVIDAIVSMEQAMIVFRQRHARMVERMIGRRTGTGGSAGVAYLDETALRYRIFDELWAVRSLLIRAEALPSLQAPQAYDLSTD